MTDRPSGDERLRCGAVAGSPGAHAVVVLLVTRFIRDGALPPFGYRGRTYPGGPVVCAAMIGVVCLLPRHAERRI